MRLLIYGFRHSLKVVGHEGDVGLYGDFSAGGAHHIYVGSSQGGSITYSSPTMATTCPAA